MPSWSLAVPEWLPFAIAGGAGVLLAAIVALVSGPSRLDAAVAIDRAFHLNERLGTALTLPSDLLETPAGRALLDDTKRHLRDLDIGSKFGLRIPRAAWVPVVPALIGVGLALRPRADADRRPAPGASTNAEDLEKISKEVEALKKRMAEVKKRLEDGEHAESDKLLVEIEKAADELTKAPPAEKQEALIKLNKLTNALEERQKQIGDSQQISKKLQQLDQMTSDGPADELARELAKGDFQQAAEQGQGAPRQAPLRQDDRGGEEGAPRPARRDAEEARGDWPTSTSGRSSSKEALDEGPDQPGAVRAADGQAERPGRGPPEAPEARPAARPGPAADGSQGDMQKAAEALGMSQQQLDQMAAEMAELEMLDSAMADLQMAKDGMTGGDGLNQIGDRLDGMNSFGQGMGMGNNTGQGLGRGRGRGDRPIAADDTSTYNTKVDQQLGRGKAVQEGFGPPGAQTVGDSIIEAQATIEANSAAAAEALSNQKVPRHIERQVQNYFDSFRAEDN